MRVLLLAMLLASTARADPLVLRASGAVNYDSNVFRLADGVQPLSGNGRDDLIALAQVSARSEANLSLQQFVIDASATRYEYSRHKELSFTGLSLSGTWNWQVGPRVSGAAGYDLQRRQTSFAEYRNVGRNIVTVKQPFIEARYLPGSSLFAYGGLRHISVNNSSLQLEAADYRSDIVNGGAGYALRNGGDIRLGIRRTDQRFPNDQFVLIGGVPVLFRNDYRQDEAEASIRYPFGAKTLLVGRVAYTERRVEQATERNFSGVTGRLQLDYRPDALWGYQIVARRELTSYDDIQTNFVTTNALAWSVDWRPRAFLTLRADAEINKRIYEGFSIVAPTLGRRDKNRTAGLAASYQWQRGSRLDLGVRHEVRNSTFDQLDYDAVTASATVTLAFGGAPVSR